MRCRLMHINAVGALPALHIQMPNVHPLPDKWLPVAIAPSDVGLEVCVLDERGLHALVFPVHKRGIEWVDASTKKRIDIAPTHWRKWSESTAV
jgi:hypothetical protein